MSKYRTYNWPQLFAAFEQSGLSKAEFCKQHDLNAKYFSSKLSKRKAQEGGAFAQIVVQPEPVSPQGLVLEVGNCKINCPGTMPFPSFVSLVQSLALSNGLHLFPSTKELVVRQKPSWSQGKCKHLQPNRNGKSQ